MEPDHHHDAQIKQNIIFHDCDMMDNLFYKTEEDKKSDKNNSSLTHAAEADATRVPQIRIQNKIQLTKAELLLIRQKISK